MKAIIQNVVAVAVVAGLTYAGVVYGIDTSSTMRKEAKTMCLMGSCIVDTPAGTVVVGSTK